MGFSVSASAAIIFLSAFMAFGMLYPAVANGYEQVTESHADATDRDLAQQNTAIQLSNTSYADGNLSVDVENAGTTALSVEATDVLVNNTYRSAVSSQVEGDANTDLWLPGETLTVTVSAASNDGRVTVVTEHGVSAGRDLP